MQDISCLILSQKKAVRTGIPAVDPLTTDEPLQSSVRHPRRPLPAWIVLHSLIRPVDDTKEAPMPADEFREPVSWSNRMSSRRHIVALVLSATAGVVAFFLVPEPLPELTRQELIDEIHAGHVHQIVVVDGDMIRAVSTTRGTFRAVLPRGGDEQLIDDLRAMGVEVKFETTPLGQI
jgi:hypothetical protein